jgi:SAM-dependent methyltransferase
VDNSAVPGILWTRTLGQRRGPARKVATVEEVNVGRRETVRYHEDFYATHELFEAGSWLHKPSPFVMRSLAHLDTGRPLVAVDLGAGVGRHTIPVADRLPEGSYVVAVDLLPLAAQRLHRNAEAAGVRDRVQAVVADLDSVALAPDSVDWLVSVSALEHATGLEMLERVLGGCQRATRTGGLNCLIIGTEKVEIDAAGRSRPARVEFHLPAVDAEALLERMYADWERLEYSSAAFAVDEDRDGESYTLSTTNLRLLARRR